MNVEIFFFQTNRKEVERILGTPKDDDGTVNYESDDALVHILYSTGSCKPDRLDRGKYAVAKDMVIWYWVVLKKMMDLSAMDLTNGDYVRSIEPHIAKSFNYDNAKKGIRVETRTIKGEEKISSIYFDPTLKMKRRARCKVSWLNYSKLAVSPLNRQGR